MGVPVGRVQQDGIYVALLLHIRFEVPVHQAPRDAACQLLRLQLAWIVTSHLHPHTGRHWAEAAGEGEGGGEGRLGRAAEGSGLGCSYPTLHLTKGRLA